MILSDTTRSKLSSHRKESGTVTLTSEAVLLFVLCVVGFGGAALLAAKANTRMEHQSTWMECASVLDCPSPQPAASPQAKPR